MTIAVSKKPSCMVFIAMDVYEPFKAKPETKIIDSSR